MNHLVMALPFTAVTGYFNRLFAGYIGVLTETAMALVPLLGIFLIYQIFFLKMPRAAFLNTLKGVLMAFVGLTLFLQGVNTGYIPVGRAIGAALASLDYNWILLPIGFVLGFFITIAEPSVQVLTEQIDAATSGFIKKKVMMATLCIGVAISVVMAVYRTLNGLSLWAFIVPGYLVALVLTNFVSQDFAAIAFDSGGVATGTMTATFLLSMTIGIAEQVENADPLVDGFGVISLVAMMPILMVLLLGVLYKMQMNPRRGEGRAAGRPKRFSFRKEKAS